MRTYENIKQVRADIVNKILKVDDDIEIAFDGFKIEADIICHNIYSKDERRNISAWDITARDITALGISAGDISAWDISARNITAWDISAGDISAWDISARDISARNITAWDISTGRISAGDIRARSIRAGDISYYAVCFAYENISCRSIQGRRNNSRYFCLDGEVTIKKPRHTITIDGKDMELSEESFNNLKNQLNNK